MQVNRKSHLIEKYYPNFIKTILPKLETKDAYNLCLLGFNENMKWLARLLSEKNIEFNLYDWRNPFLGYECCKKEVNDVNNIKLIQKPLIIICPEELDLLREVIILLAEDKSLNSIPVIYESGIFQPTRQIKSYKEIVELAKETATSVNTEDRLYNLIQLVQESISVEGDIVEFGSFSGGTGAIINETLLKSDIHKQIYLFDSFEGLPVSPLGVDERWGGTFSNICYQEVANNFKKFKNVNIIKGNLVKEVYRLQDKISFAHIDVDTYHAVKKVTEHIYPLLSKGGIILYDDYGFSPNCLPLTFWVDNFYKNRIDCFKFYLPSNGFFIIKK